MDGPTAAQAAERAAVQRAARGLEETLLRQALQAMARAQLEHGGFFGSGAAAGYQTTFEMLLGEALAERAPLGLAEQAAEQLTRGPGSAAAATAAAERARKAASEADVAGVFRNFTLGAQVPPPAAEETSGGAPPVPFAGQRGRNDENR